jgi:hypothetical protein
MIVLLFLIQSVQRKYKMGFSPRMYEIHVFLERENGVWWWEPVDSLGDFDEASKWYERYKDTNMSVRIVETKIVKAFENGKEYT